MNERCNAPPGDHDRRGKTSRSLPFSRVGGPMARVVLACVRSLAPHMAAPAGAQQPRCRDWAPGGTAAGRPHDAGAAVHRGHAEMVAIAVPPRRLAPPTLGSYNLRKPSRPVDRLPATLPRKERLSHTERVLAAHHADRMQFAFGRPLPWLSGDRHQPGISDRHRRNMQAIHTAGSRQRPKRPLIACFRSKTTGRPHSLVTDRRDHRRLERRYGAPARAGGASRPRSSGSPRKP